MRCSADFTLAASSLRLSPATQPARQFRESLSLGSRPIIASTMIAPSDESYVETKRIRKLGLVLDSSLRELASWIGSEYSVRVLNIRLDTVIPDDRPRIEVILETSPEVNRFRELGSINFDQAAKQRVKAEFLALRQRHGRPFADDRRLFVVFSAFEPVARWEACSHVHQSQLDELTVSIGFPDLWCLRISFDHLLIFFFTASQASKHQQSSLREQIEGMVGSLISPHDEFGYFQSHPVASTLDSKEVFDRDYRGSWFNYLR